MGRWVLLKHELGDGSWHYDWLMEPMDPAGSVGLIGFRVQERLDDPGVHELTAQRLAAHRTVYLDYEGPISGGRGQVVRVASGAGVVIRDDQEFWVHMAGPPARRWIGLIEDTRGSMYRFRAD